MARPFLALGSCCGHRNPAGEVSPLLAAPASTPWWTEEKGSTQGSRGGLARWHTSPSDLLGPASAGVRLCRAGRATGGCTLSRSVCACGLLICRRRCVPGRARGHVHVFAVCAGHPTEGGGWAVGQSSQPWDRANPRTHILQEARPGPVQGPMAQLPNLLPPLEADLVLEAARKSGGHSQMEGGLLAPRTNAASD